MFFSMNNAIWFYPCPVDFRKGIDGLVILIASQLELKPASGQLFLFRDRTAKKIKMLWFDHNGFWLFYKRLEKGRLKFPPIKNNVMELTRDQLNWLLSGLDFLNPQTLPTLKPSQFY